ncbi:MAG TPA: hypothetical protein DEG55_05820 [Acidaminococcaceae bacterium]|nr:hypothetical protein [Acidaminococcaceae bacterium]
MYEGRPLYVREEKLRLESGGNRFPDAKFHFMHIVPETHFGFGMEGAICSRAFIFLRGIVACCKKVLGAWYSLRCAGIGVKKNCRRFCEEAGVVIAICCVGGRKFK